MDSRPQRGAWRDTMGGLIADACASVGADVGLMGLAGGIRADRTYDAGTELTRLRHLTELPLTAPSS